LFASSGENLAKANGCMECHNLMGKKLAPAFMGTARKNIKIYGNDAKAKIVESIKTGSKGKYRNFTDIEMPPYSHLKEDELNTLADWILSEYAKNKHLQSNKKVNGQGKKKNK